MGIVLSRLAKWFGFWWEPECKILLLGLDNAGKTTLLYWLRLRTAIVTIPTVGMNVEEVRVPGAGITMLTWDIGGQEKLRKLWSRFFADTRGVIFVVDSADTCRFDEVSTELSKLFNDPVLCEVPFLIFANKQDVPEAKSPQTIRNCLKVFNSADNQAVQTAVLLKPAVATTGKGLQEALIEFGSLVRERMKTRRNVS
ncbi:ADP-ribosylation factor [Fasciola gigantica]|uniref:ADP-ribosylation factor n=2 Tax=Fasciola TaxID=6191 RepID=A0A2H1BSN8_FASHE|nr:ADP-ribosylation factor [Fasciola hepatica]TPP64018.1 ADP-ribosylation factor [Fasciola gigantica]